MMKSETTVGERLDGDGQPIQAQQMFRCGGYRDSRGSLRYAKSDLPLEQARWLHRPTGPPPLMINVQSPRIYLRCQVCHLHTQPLIHPLLIISFVNVIQLLRLDQPQDGDGDVSLCCDCSCLPAWIIKRPPGAMSATSDECDMKHLLSIICT